MLNEIAEGIADRIANGIADEMADGVVAVPFDVGPDLQHEIEQFLFFEAELLDDRRFEEWYGLFAPDVRYRIPTRSNRLRRERDADARTDAEQDRSVSAPGEVNLFDDDKETLGWRVRQMETGRHWAEDPPSRTRHLVTNVRIRPEVAPGGAGGTELAVRSNFLCYRNRLQTEVDLWAGERHDVLRALGGRRWQIARRTVLLDQSVLLSKNLSVFL
jgi:biphenyl 2,3-dioxygenase beta subunit